VPADFTPSPTATPTQTATPTATVTPGRPVAGHHSTGHAVGPDDGRADQGSGQPAEPPLALLGVTAFCLARRAPVRYAGGFAGARE
jgi:hypothetical protein